MAIVLALLVGALLGYYLERGDFCFHSTWRDLLADPPKNELVKAYLLFLVISIPLVRGMVALGWIEPWIPPLAWPANLLGGMLFGVGMTIASTCITGVFYKFGHGMLGMALAFVAWSAGDVLTYAGPLAPLREGLNANPVEANGAAVTLLSGNVWLGPIILLALLGTTAVYLKNAHAADRGKQLDWVKLGAALALVMSAAWPIARLVGVDYTFGTSGVPTALFAGGGTSTWIIVTLFAIVPGAFIAARRHGTLWVRGETPQRYAQLAIGGFIMGIGAAIAGGCNLGHGMVGVSLLSIGSIVSTLAIIGGIFFADRVVKLWQARRVDTAVAV